LPHATELFHRCAAQILIVPDQALQIFRVELFRQGGRSHQVTKHHRHAAALGVGCWCGGGEDFLRPQGLDGFQKLLAVAKCCHADPLKISVGQVLQDLGINFV
jgi:hypothetical protein